MRKAAVLSTARPSYRSVILLGSMVSVKIPQKHLSFKIPKAQSIENPVLKVAELFCLVPMPFEKKFPEAVWLFLNCWVLFLISKFTLTLFTMVGNMDKCVSIWLCYFCKIIEALWTDLCFSALEIISYTPYLSTFYLFSCLWVFYMHVCLCNLFMHCPPWT